MDELRLTVRDHRPFAAPDVVGVASYDLSDVSDAAEPRWVPLAPAMDRPAASACLSPCARSGGIIRRRGGAEATLRRRPCSAADAAATAAALAALRPAPIRGGWLMS